MTTGVVYIPTVPLRKQLEKYNSYLALCRVCNYVRFEHFNDRCVNSPFKFEPKLCTTLGFYRTKVPAALMKDVAIVFVGVYTNYPMQFLLDRTVMFPRVVEMCRAKLGMDGPQT